MTDLGYLEDFCYEMSETYKNYCGELRKLRKKFDVEFCELDWSLFYRMKQSEIEDKRNNRYKGKKKKLPSKQEKMRREMFEKF